MNYLLSEFLAIKGQNNTDDSIFSIKEVRAQWIFDHRKIKQKTDHDIVT